MNRIQKLSWSIEQDPQRCLVSGTDLKLYEWDIKVKSIDLEKSKTTVLQPDLSRYLIG